MYKHLIFFILVFCFHYDSATIIILQGTSCAGKTSICKELKKLDSTWKLIDQDQMSLEYYQKNLAHIFPHDIKIILKVIAPDNVFHAIERNQVCFNEDVLEEDKQKALDSINKIREVLMLENEEVKVLYKLWRKVITNNMIKQIRDLSITGNNVIIDDVGCWLLPEHVDKLKNEFKVLKVLAYCPLDHLIKRVLKRNIESVGGKFNQARFFKIPLLNFKTMYAMIPESEISNLDLEEKHIDSLSLKNIECSLGLVESNIKELSQDNKDLEEEFSIKSFKKFKYELMKNFYHDNTCYVVPAKQYDIILSTHNYNSIECAQALLVKIALL